MPATKLMLVLEGIDMNFTYVVQCSDETLYTGWTSDIMQRLKVHNSGQGAKYTRSRLPVRLVYYEVFATKEEAMSREWHIKRLTRDEKINLVNTVDSKLKDDIERINVTINDAFHQ